MDNWDNVKVTFGGREIKGIKGLEYTDKKESISLKGNQSVTIERDVILEFICKRKNKYYFKSVNGFRHTIETEQDLKLVKGHSYRFL